ncbi:MAG TPA: cadherin-like domain-containing protein, partial [Acidimicrobiia bacterium]
MSFVIVTSGVSLAETIDATDAIDDSATIAGGTGANPIDVLANDTSVTGGTLVITEVIGDFDGSVTVTDGGFGLTYEPAVDFCGVESFTYTVSDGVGGTDTATVTVEVTCEPAEEESAVE